MTPAVPVHYTRHIQHRQVWYRHAFDSKQAEKTRADMAKLDKYLSMSEEELSERVEALTEHMPVEEFAAMHQELRDAVDGKLDKRLN